MPCCTTAAALRPLQGNDKCLSAALLLGSCCRLSTLCSHPYQFSAAGERLRNFPRIMDPVTLIGTAGAASNIIEVLNSAISSIHRLCSRWNDADLILLSVIAQLTALRAALRKIQEWTQADWRQRSRASPANYRPGQLPGVLPHPRLQNRVAAIRSRPQRRGKLGDLQQIETRFWGTVTETDPENG